jgi:hypothetical protein
VNRRANIYRLCRGYNAVAMLKSLVDSGRGHQCEIRKTSGNRQLTTTAASATQSVQYF